jgi:YHS domain-containing protein
MLQQNTRPLFQPHSQSKGIAMSLLRVVLLALLVAGPAAAQMVQPKEALDGVDPVALLTQGKEVMGKAEFKVSCGGFDYLFASAENKASFEKTPDKYEIQLGGACARMGGGATGNPADYAVVDGKIYVFGTDECHKKFVASPSKYLEKPAAAMPTASSASAQGRALVDRAVRALGGADRLDALTTYVESSSQMQKRPAGDMLIAVKTMWRFPGGVRAERTTTQGERTTTTANLVTPEGAWFLGQDRVYPQNANGRRSTEQEYGRQIVPLLRGRKDPGFQAAAIGAGAADGAPVDLVRVRNGAVDVTLGLDKASGLIRSISFVARNRDSEVGEYTLLLDNVRDVSGLRLPFSQRALFNGAPDDFLTRKVDSIVANAPLDPALFQPTASGR